MENLTPVAEDYLKTVYQVEQEFGRRARSIEIAESMGVSAASVTDMMQKLDEMGMISHTEYKGVETTECGKEATSKIVRKHRLIECFLTELPGFSWADVHQEADRLEHHVSDDFADALAEYLGNPDVDPHGDPIPPVGTERSDETGYVPLARCESGDEAVVRQVHDRDPEVSSFLHENGISPGTLILVDSIHSVGLVDVRTGDSDNSVSLPEHVARRVRVEQN